MWGVGSHQTGRFPTMNENVTALPYCHFGVFFQALFQAIAAVGVVADKKPAPDTYRWAMEHFGVTSNVCLAIGDSRNGSFQLILCYLIQKP